VCICLDGPIIISRFILEHNHKLVQHRCSILENKNLEPHI